MDYEQFKRIAEKIGVDVGNGAIRVEWTTGGRKGGDCWGNDYGSFDPEEEPEFHNLDKLLEATAPKLSYLQGKAIDRELVRYGNHQRDDYYGRHQELAYKEVFLIDLHAWLSERNLLESP